MPDFEIEEKEIPLNSVPEMWDQVNFVQGGIAPVQSNNIANDILMFVQAYLGKNPDVKKSICGHNWLKPELDEYFVSMKILLRHKSALKILISELNEDFSTFATKFEGTEPLVSKKPPVAQFEKWVGAYWATSYDRMGPSTNIPVNFDQTHSEQIEKLMYSYYMILYPNFARSTAPATWEGRSALSLFFYWLFLKLGIINPNGNDASFSANMHYTTQFGDANALLDLMKKGGMFLEAKQNPSMLIHGKYSHALQLVLLCKAAKRGWISLPCEPSELAYFLATSKTILGVSAWDTILEPNVEFQNTIMMHPSMCMAPLRNYWSMSLYKWFINKILPLKPSQGLPGGREDILCNLIANCLTIGSHDKELIGKWQKDYGALPIDGGAIWQKHKETNDSNENFITMSAKILQDVITSGPQ